MQPAKIKNHTLDRSAHCLREALSVWLSAGEEIHYAAEDSDIFNGHRIPGLTRLRRGDNQENIPRTEPDLCPPAHGTGRPVAPQNPRKYRYFS